MNDRYTSICERIRERCQQQKYYGPDGGWHDYRGYFDADGKLQVRDLTHDPQKPRHDLLHLYLSSPLD